MQVPIGGTFWLPGIPPSGSTTDTGATLDATGDYIAFVLQAPATGVIDKAFAWVGSTTLVGTLSCQIQTLDSVGDPSGTAYGSCTQVDVTVSGTEDNAEMTFSGLACNATAGDYICVKIWASAITSGSLTVRTPNVLLSGTIVMSLPYQTVVSTGSGAGAHASSTGYLALEYSGGVYHDIGLAPPGQPLSENLDADGSLRRVGNLFTLPAPVTVSHVWACIDNDTDTTTIKIYDTDGTTVLATATLVAANRTGTGGGIQLVKLSTDVELKANTASPYRVVVETNNTSSTAVSIRGLTGVTAARMAQMPMGAACHYTSHNGTAWTDTATKRAFVGLLVSKIENVLGRARANFNLGI